MDVVFVNMPFAAIQRPSIALGTLKSILVDAGLKVHVAYANLWYAEYAGLEHYLRIENTRSQDVLGDWIFGPAAFPEHRPDHEAYLARLLRANRALARGSAETTAELLTRIRNESLAFVHWAADRILELNPSIVGCTSMFQQNVASLALLRRIREKAPGIVTMMGGANCETVMGRTLHQNFDWVDYVVSGEADELIVDLCRRALAEGRDIAPAEVPFGTLAPCHRREGYPQTKSGDGVPRAIVQDMRKVPAPDYSDYFAELETFLYGANILPSLPIETSRGCWWGAKSHCTFCGLNGGSMSYRAKPPAQARAEIEMLVERHKVNRIQAVDNILSSHYLADMIPDLAERKEKLSVFFEVKANLKRHQVELFSRAGISSIQPGIESLDTRVLQLMRKGCAAWQNVLLLKWCRQFGVDVAWSIIYGFPGEEDEWHAQTARLLPALHHFQVGGLNLLRYDRYSPYFNRPADWGLSLKAGGAYRFAYPLDAASLEGVAYFMEVDRPGAGGAVERGPGLAALSEAHAAWRQAVRPAGPPPWRMPILAMERLIDGAIVKDTRACALADTMKLNPLEVAMLDAADAAPSLASFRSGMAAQHGVDDDEVERAIQHLLEARHLVIVDGRAVSLVLEHPVPPRLRLHDQPLGYIRPRKPGTGLENILSLEPAGA